MSSSDAESIPELTPQTIECEEELETFEDIPENDQEHVQVLEAESVDEQGNQDTDESNFEYNYYVVNEEGLAEPLVFAKEEEPSVVEKLYNKGKAVEAEDLKQISLTELGGRKKRKKEFDMTSYRELRKASLTHTKLQLQLNQAANTIAQAQAELRSLLQRMLPLQAKRLALKDQEPVAPEDINYDKILTKNQYDIIISEKEFIGKKSGIRYDEVSYQRSKAIFENIGHLGYINLRQHGIPMPHSRTLFTMKRKRKEGPLKLIKEDEEANNLNNGNNDISMEHLEQEYQQPEPHQEPPPHETQQHLEPERELKYPDHQAHHDPGQLQGYDLSQQQQHQGHHQPHHNQQPGQQQHHLYPSHHQSFVL